jgi:putative NADH-flavin reductase
MVTSKGTMKIALFGGTGPTGQELIQQGLARGHSIRALVRSPQKLTIRSPELHVVQGDAKDDASVQHTLAGTEAVVVSLGGKGFARSTMLEEATAHIIAAMKKTELKRLIVVTSLGVGDSKGQAGFFFEKIIVPLLLRHEFAAKERQEALVCASGLDYVLVRPGGLQTKPAVGKYQVARKLMEGSSARITRADVAHFCLEQLTRNDWLGQAVSLSN